MFFQAPIRTISLELAFEKCEKECNMLSINLVQGFLPLKIKVISITQFPNGFHLHCFCSVACNQLLKNNTGFSILPRLDKGWKCSQKISWYNNTRIN